MTYQLQKFIKLHSRNKSSSNQRMWKKQIKEPTLTAMPQMIPQKISFKNQEFEQDRHCQFVGFQPHITDTILQDNKKGKCNISGALCSICLKFAGCCDLILNFVAMVPITKILLAFVQKQCFFTIRRIIRIRRVYFSLRNDITCSNN